jgi:hypothetical protein
VDRPKGLLKLYDFSGSTFGTLATGIIQGFFKKPGPPPANSRLKVI